MPAMCTSAVTSDVVSWVVMPSNVNVGYQRFGRPSCLHLHGWSARWTGVQVLEATHSNHDRRKALSRHTQIIVLFRAHYSSLFPHFFILFFHLPTISFWPFLLPLFYTIIIITIIIIISSAPYWVHCILSVRCLLSYYYYYYYYYYYFLSSILSSLHPFC
jgi:hypothetical protein